MNDISDFFDYFFDDDVINLIVTYTNKRLKEDEKTNAIEIRAFIGLMLLFGVTKKNDVDIGEIWCSDSVHHLNYASAGMTRSRFQRLSNKITFDDIETRFIRQRQYGKFYLIHEFFEIIRKKVVNAFNPGMNLKVDEQLYSFRGRCSFRQYMKS